MCKRRVMLLWFIFTDTKHIDFKQNETRPDQNPDPSSNPDPEETGLGQVQETEDKTHLQKHRKTVNSRPGLRLP